MCPRQTRSLTETALFVTVLVILMLVGFVFSITSDTSVLVRVFMGHGCSHHPAGWLAAVRPCWHKQVLNIGEHGIKSRVVASEDPQLLIGSEEHILAYMVSSRTRLP